MVGIFSPPMGGVLAVVERLLIRAANGQSLQLSQQSPGTQAITTTVSGTLHDSRWAGGLSTALMGSGSLVANSGALLARVVMPASGFLDMPFDHVLAPGGNFMIQGEAVDETFSVTICWRERRHTPWERA